MDYEALGRRISAQRKLCRMSREELARQAEISLSFLGHVERGTRKASLETLIAIANALNISTDFLLQDSLKNDLLGTNDNISLKQRSMLREIADVLRNYDQ